MDHGIIKQPKPKGQGEEVLPFVMQDMKQRVFEGEAIYGERLRTRNGRDPLIDAYQEALDLCLYLKQALMERDE